MSYVFHARCVNLLAFQGRQTEAKELSQKVFELERKIGNLDTAPKFLYDQFIRERQLFYIFYAISALEYQK